MKQFMSCSFVSLFTVVTAFGLGGCTFESNGQSAGQETAEAEEVKGPNGGRLLIDGDFAIEVTIFETGVDPQFRLYGYRNSELVPAGDITATLELERLGDVIDRFSFTPEGDYLVGDGIVTEPHSFVVSVAATHNGRTSTWTYDSLEGRTEVPDSVAAAAGIETEVAGPASVGMTLPVTGKIAFAPDATADIKAPYAARVLSVEKSVGDRVQRGETLARLENVVTLQPFGITAPADGVVIARNTNVGDVAGAEPLFMIGDTAQLEARLHIFPGDQQRVQPGMTVMLASPSGGEPIVTTISAYMPMANAASQTLIARASIPADAGVFPGLRVNGEIVVHTINAPLAVRTSGLQRFRDFTVVFAKVDETYEVRMLDLGARDRDWAVVHGGLEPGTEYVVANAFLLKADVEKDGASHDH